MDFGLDDAQLELVGSFAGLLARRSPSERVRAAELQGVDDELWWALQDVGIVIMVVGEAHGGWGAGLLDAALVAEEVGRVLASAPVIEAQVAARLLASVAGTGGPEAARATEALGRVLEERQLVTLAVRPVRGGAATMVPAGAICDGWMGLDGDRLILTSVDGPARQPVANLAQAPLADMEIDPASTVELAVGPAAVELYEAAIDEWLALTAAALVGIGLASHQLVCGYARERRAFGAPIGSFQAVAHPLADDATDLDGARLLARKAAWTIDRQDRRARELAAMAFAFASRTAATATYNGVHLHGGYGFMLEHDAQLFHRRARGWARLWGDPSSAERRAAQARYGAPAAPSAEA